MAAVNTDLLIFAGEDNTPGFIIYQPGGGTTPQDITGWTLRFVVWPILGGAVVVTKTPTITNAAGGTGTVSLLQADLTTLQYASVWNYRIERIDSGFDNWLTYGKLTIAVR